jgi:hypothetical protein
VIDVERAVEVVPVVALLVLAHKPVAAHLCAAVQGAPVTVPSFPVLVLLGGLHDVVPTRGIESTTSEHARIPHRPVGEGRDGVAPDNCHGRKVEDGYEVKVIFAEQPQFDRAASVREMVTGCAATMWASSAQPPPKHRTLCRL